MKGRLNLYMKITKNFSSDEFACKCCGRQNINENLVFQLQKIRGIVKKPIIITSGYRCPAHNKKIGGSPKSQHLKGNAADIVIKGYSVKQMYETALTLYKKGIGGIGIYPEQGFIHLDVREQPAFWVYLKSRRKYLSLQGFQALLLHDQDLKDQYEKIR